MEATQEIKDFIERELIELAKTFVEQRKATLTARKIEATGELKNSLAYEINNQAKAEGFDAETLAHIIRRSCEIKAEVVTQDERESGLRKILNYGHTIGHALEAVTHYRRLKHGEAVGYGMKAAANMALKSGLLAKDERAAIDAGVDALGCLPHIHDLQVPDILAAMTLDKKASQGKVPLILPTTIGEVIVRDDVGLTIVRASVKELLSTN